MYVRVKAFPDAGKEAIEEVGENRLRIFVREPPADNRANKRVCELVARHYGIAPAAVHIVSGHHRMNKLLQIHSS